MTNLEANIQNIMDLSAITRQEAKQDIIEYYEHALSHKFFRDLMLKDDNFLEALITIQNNNQIDF